MLGKGKDCQFFDEENWGKGDLVPCAEGIEIDFQAEDICAGVFRFAVWPSYSSRRGAMAP